MGWVAVPQEAQAIKGRKNASKIQFRQHVNDIG
jgi:hypothetical protein